MSEATEATAPDVPEIPSGKRSPFLAAFLSFLCTGLGQIYNGRPKKGLIFFFAITLYYPASMLLGAGFSFKWLALSLVPWFVIWIWNIVDAFQEARRVQTIELKKYNRGSMYLIILVAATFIVSPLVKSIALVRCQAFSIPSRSMTPAILPGDRIMTQKGVYDDVLPKRGEVVVFKQPGEDGKMMIKRVMAVAGDQVEVRMKMLWVNGQCVQDDPGKWSDSTTYQAPKDDFGPVTVPQGQVFLMGDNRENSFDSRFFGTVSREKLLGKALYIYWSMDLGRRGDGIRWDRIGMPVM